MAALAMATKRSWKTKPDRLEGENPLMSPKGWPRGWDFILGPLRGPWRAVRREEHRQLWGVQKPSGVWGWGQAGLEGTRRPRRRLRQGLPQGDGVVAWCWGLIGLGDTGLPGG